MKSKKEQLYELYEGLKLNSERIGRLENTFPKYPRIRIPDYTDELRLVRRSIDAFLHSGQQQEMSDIMLQIRELVSRMPHVVHVRHHHHFAKLTKRVISAFLILVMLLGLSIWLAYYFYKH